MNSQTKEARIVTYDVEYKGRRYHVRVDVPLGVHFAVVDAVGIGDEDVMPAAALEADIGLESINWLDVVFRLEKFYGVEIPRSDWFPDYIFFDEKYRQPVPAGSTAAPRLNAAGVALVKEQVSWLDSDQMGEFERDPVIAQFNDLITIGAITQYLLAKFPEKFWIAEHAAGSQFRDTSN